VISIFTVLLSRLSRNTLPFGFEGGAGIAGRFF